MQVHLCLFPESSSWLTFLRNPKTVKKLRSLIRRFVSKVGKVLKSISGQLYHTPQRTMRKICCPQDPPWPVNLCVTWGRWGAPCWWTQPYTSHHCHLESLPPLRLSVGSHWWPGWCIRDLQQDTAAITMLMGPKAATASQRMQHIQVLTCKRWEKQVSTLLLLNAGLFQKGSLDWMLNFKVLLGKHSLRTGTNLLGACWLRAQRKCRGQEQLQHRVAHGAWLWCEAPEYYHQWEEVWYHNMKQSGEMEWKMEKTFLLKQEPGELQRAAACRTSISGCVPNKHTFWEAGEIVRAPWHIALLWSLGQDWWPVCELSPPSPEETSLLGEMSPKHKAEESPRPDCKGESKVENSQH